MQPQPYTAINASAGSGKTYALVQRILMLCLAYENQHDSIRHILALTFTNKAANEMKARILSWLKEFTNENYQQNDDLKNLQEKLKDRGINASVDDLHRRAKKVLDYILHNYSALNISTIDKFNSRLVRSFSYELGLAHQFNLEINSEPYLIEAVDKMLDSIGEDPQISEAFLDFVNYNLDNDDRINLNRTLYRKAKEFIGDVHHQALEMNRDFGWQSYNEARDRLRAEIRQHQDDAENASKSALALMKANSLEIGDFAKGINGIGGFFKKYLDKGEPLIYDSPDAETLRTTEMLKGASAKSKKRQDDILGILDQLLELRRVVIVNFVESQKKKQILKELLPLKFNREIQEKLQEIESENDLVMLSKFNVLISENLKNEPSAFIYEKIGTKYQHYFFDEFQDTSRMQWHNLLPLRDNTITSDAHTFTLVGDPKQSIYRFRGGDSELMLDILNRKETTPTEVYVENLAFNWRSAQNIVDFNNALYTFATKDLLGAHRKLFSEDAQQTGKKDRLGRVKVFLTEYTKSSDPFYDNVAEQMQRDIQECVDNGFSLKDITVLCLKSKEIQQLSQRLLNKKIKYDGKEIFIKTISERGLTLQLSDTLQALLYLLRWEIQPENHQHFIRMMMHLKNLGKINPEDFTAAMLEMLAQPSKSDILQALAQQYNLELDYKNRPNLNLYNRMEFLLGKLSVPGKETDFLLNFLEMLYGFTQNSGLTVKDFVKFWDEEGSKMSIQASANLDAVKFMTIHASKGLEFPVVFHPMFNTYRKNNNLDWLPLEGQDTLKSVHTKPFDSKLGTYDAGIAKFNTDIDYRLKIDRFCLQYVATTRPVEQLFLYIQSPPENKSGEQASQNEIYYFVKGKMPEDATEFDLYPEHNNSYRKATGKKAPLKNTVSINLHNEEVDAATSNIRIATPSRQYQNTVATVRNGIFAHEILSKIETSQDLEPVLQGYLLAGEITQNEAENIKVRILNVILKDENKVFFQENVKVITEKDIMISRDGLASLYRPDRLVETAQGFYIVDFKTGAEKPEHQHQIESYRTVLEELGHQVLATKIIYI